VSRNFECVGCSVVAVDKNVRAPFGGGFAALGSRGEEHRSQLFTAFVSLILYMLLTFTSRAEIDLSPRQIVSMDSNWLFTKGDPVNGEAVNLDDRGWRRLDIPHDWGIDGPFDEKNPTGGAGAFLPAGIGWYRKYFTVPEAYNGRQVFMEFDGVMANSDVWINGQHLGKRPYGYVSFQYDLTPHLKFGTGQTNVIAVRADNSGQPASRWYAGAGIYRHVRMVLTGPLHFEHWATFVTTPEVTSTQALVRIQTIVTNESGSSQNIKLQVMVRGGEGRNVLSAETDQQTIPSGSSAKFEKALTVPNPLLWDLAHPNLYSLSAIIRPISRLPSKPESLDEETISFGIREARFEPDTGFWLNGQNLKIKGVCLHHDGGAFGAAVPLGVWERRLAALKALGCNAIRTAHNPPAPEFLSLCDRMGFLVMDEMFDCWTVAKNRYDYHLYFTNWSKIDTRDTVRRDRNHPSIVVYSAGNEIHDTPKAELAKQILSGLIEVFHENDPSRPVSQALFRPNVSHDYDNGLADLLDVVGQNYRENEILAAHEAKPSRKILGTENGHDRKAWLALRDNPPYAGQFLWSGIDYLGESRRWPIFCAGSGLLDRTGAPHPRAFQRQSWWSDKPMVRIVRRIAPSRLTPSDPGFEPLMRVQQEFPDWTPRNAEPHEEDVEVYSNCEQLELLLNGKSLGSKSLPSDASPRQWRVPFAVGHLVAIATENKKEVARDELRTAGKPARIRLTTDHPKLTPAWDDVAFLEATITDDNGVLVPDASDRVSFGISGPGTIVAVDNADNASHETFHARERRAYQGRCVAVIRANGSSGNIDVTASAQGLKPGALQLKAAKSGSIVQN